MTSRAAKLRQNASREDGLALIFTVIALFVLLGIAALVIDFGRAYLAQRQLQQAVDAAALVAGQTLPNSTSAKAQAIAYSATGKNAHANSMTANAPTVTFKCLQTLANNNVPCLTDPAAGSPCAASGALPNGCNAVQVVQTATLPTTFGRWILPTLTVSARSTVGMRGGVPHPLDIMVVLDRTGSMQEPCSTPVLDANKNVIINNPTKLDCAKDGVRQLLKGLLPCQPNVIGACGSATPLDEVGLMTFPPLNAPLSTSHDRGSGAVPAANEVDTLNVSGNPRNNPPFSSYFTVSVNGQTTAHITWPTSAGVIQTALLDLPGLKPGDVSVTGINPQWTLTFANGLGSQAVTVTVNPNLPRGSIAANQVTPGSPAIPKVEPLRTNRMLDSTSSCAAPAGASSWPSWYAPSNKQFPNWFIDQSDVGYGSPAVPAADEVDHLTVTGPPLAPNSYFTMTVNGQTTAHITWPTSAGAIQTALEALSNVIPGDVTVTGNNPQWTLTFANGLGSQPVTVTVNPNLNPGSMSVGQVTAGKAGTPQVDPNYTFAPLSNDFRTSDAPGLNANSLLVNAISWASCPGGSTNGIASETSAGYPGNQYYGLSSQGNTYYTGALIAAQSALAAAAAQNPSRSAQSVIIFLTDGEANTGSLNPCSTAISAAQAAAAAKTWIYSIAYNVSLNCKKPNNGGDESPFITAFHTLAQIARTSPAINDPKKFFCVGTPTPQQGESCQNEANLSQVFQSIGTSLTASRIYPDDTS